MSKRRGGSSECIAHRSMHALLYLWRDDRKGWCLSSYPRGPDLAACSAIDRDERLDKNNTRFTLLLVADLLDAAERSSKLGSFGLRSCPRDTCRSINRSMSTPSTPNGELENMSNTRKRGRGHVKPGEETRKLGTR